MANTIPVNYEQQFEPLFHNFTFKGMEIITINLSKATDLIILDAAELKIEKCYVEQRTKIITANVSLNEKNERLTIKLSKKIKGKAKLCITFTGVLNDRLLGFYKSQRCSRKGFA